MNGSQGSCAINFAYFEVNGTTNYTYSGHSTYLIWRDLDSTNFLGTYGLRCIVEDCLNNSVSLDGGTFTVYLPTTSTTSSTASTTSTPCTVTSSTTVSTAPPITNASEFGSAGVAAAILSSAPAFAYLLIKRREKKRSG